MIVCRQCGQRNDEGGEFCSACGAFLEWEGEKVDAGPPDAAVTASAAEAASAAGSRSEPVMPAAPPPDPGPQVRCLECGAFNTSGNRFCKRCGATLDLIVLAGPASTPAAPASAEPAPSGSQPPVSAPPSALPGGRQPVSGQEAAPPGVAPPPGTAPTPAPGAGRPPLAEPGDRGVGMQPAMAKTRPAPVRPEPTEPGIAPGGAACSQCGGANEAGRRFCRRCGAPLDTAAVAPPTLTAAPRLSWWQRLGARLRGRGSEADDDRYRHARAAYRTSLDLRYRVMRWLAILGTLGFGAGLLGVAGVNPVTGAQDAWRKVFPKDVQISGVTAVADPVEAELREFAAPAAVDGAPDTAWAATWQLEPGAAAVESCVVPPGFGGADAALVLSLPDPTDLSKIEIQAGLPQSDADRASQWRPTMVELRYDDGRCQQIELSDRAGVRSYDIDATDTTSVRIAVLGAAPPASGVGDLVSIGEVRLLRSD